MATSQQQLIKDAIEEVQSWTDDRFPCGLEYYFLLMNDADQSTDIDLWNELRTALASNPELQHQEVMSFLDRSYFAKEGNWWWDPHQWKTQPK